jgi:hypothetical protein
MLAREIDGIIVGSSRAHCKKNLVRIASISFYLISFIYSKRIFEGIGGTAACPRSSSKSLGRPCELAAPDSGVVVL